MMPDPNGVTNIFENIPPPGETEFFEKLVEGANVTIERIVSFGHSSPVTSWYDQGRHEWVMVIKGEAVLLFEDGARQRLTAGDYLNIPAHTRHRVEWTIPEIETVWLAVHFTGEPTL